MNAWLALSVLIGTGGAVASVHAVLGHRNARERAGHLHEQALAEITAATAAARADEHRAEARVIEAKALLERHYGEPVDPERVEMYQRHYHRVGS